MRAIIKTCLSSVSILCTLPLIILFKCLALLLNKDQLLSGFSQGLSLLPGRIGSYLRLGFYRCVLAQCHGDAFMAFGTTLSQFDTSLGKHIYLGLHCNIGSCSIEDNCLFGSGVHILSGKNQHFFADLGTPVKDQGGRFEKILIGENTWIGNGAIVMANVGKNCIIGAGSVVTTDLPDNVIACGNPAKIIKQRD